MHSLICSNDDTIIRYSIACMYRCSCCEHNLICRLTIYFMSLMYALISSVVIVFAKGRVWYVAKSEYSKHTTRMHIFVIMHVCTPGSYIFKLNAKAPVYQNLCVMSPLFFLEIHFSLFFKALSTFYCDISSELWNFQDLGLGQLVYKKGSTVVRFFFLVLPFFSCCILTVLILNLLCLCVHVFFFLNSCC